MARKRINESKKIMIKKIKYNVLILYPKVVSLRSSDIFGNGFLYNREN